MGKKRKSKFKGAELINVSDTAIPEYFELLKSEYENERQKKQSFDNRAGLVMALLGAISIFLFEKVKINDILAHIIKPLTFLDLCLIISGLIVYSGFIYTMIMIIRTINVRSQYNYELKTIDEDLLAEKRIAALCRLIFTYRDIILQHRSLNETRAKSL